ncbi:HAD family hydrolase [Paenibacillus jilunlii]|nr:HAD family hydrolase [Paenibacillus jilunlii]
MFQTLVNIEGRRNRIWKAILQQDFSEARALELGQALLNHYFAKAAAIRDAGSFCTSQEIYRSGFEKVFQEHRLNFDCHEAVDILFAEHRLSDLYADTGPFLQKISEAYQVCIVSDTDTLMLPDFYKEYPIKLFTSEDYGSYKNDGLNRMFAEVIAYYGVQPGEILHIGDSASDVLGAARAGIRSCWINRTGSAWKYAGQPPDYTVGNLEEIYAILEPGVHTADVCLTELG